MSAQVAYDPQIAERICELLTQGQSLTKICKAEGMPDRVTVWRWKKATPEFAAAYEDARRFGFELLADELLDISDDGLNDWMLQKKGDFEFTVVDHEHITRSRLRVDTRKWILAKMLPKIYGEKLELAGSQDSPLTVQIVDPTRRK